MHVAVFIPASEDLGPEDIELRAWAAVFSRLADVGPVRTDVELRPVPNAGSTSTSGRWVVYEMDVRSLDGDAPSG